MTKEGTVLDGKYEILAEVGRGGMSIVYLARDKRLNKQWAVKEIKNDGNLSKIDFRITRRPKSLPKVSDNSIDWERYIDYRKSSVRSKVEHAFHIIKNRFGFNKVRYRGIAKNLNKLNVLFASANLLMYAEAKKRSVKTKG